MKTRLPWAFALALALALLPALPALAAAATPDADLGETIVVAPPRAGAAPDPGPGAAVTVVDAAAVAGEAKDLAALVATIPGVLVEEHGGLGQYASVTIRGSEAEHVKVFLDGLPLDTAAGGGVDLAAIPAQLVSRVEVIRGVAGARYGSGALGGVVELETTPVRPGVWSAGATAGSFGSWGADAARAFGGEGLGLVAALAGGGSDGRFTFRCPDASGCGFAPAGADAIGAEGPRLHNAAANGALLLKGYWLPAAGRVDGLVQLTGYRRDLPGWPARTTPSDWQAEARGAASLRVRRPLGGGFLLDARATGRLDRTDARLSYDVNRELSERGSEAGADVALGWAGAGAALALRGEASREVLSGGDMGEHARATVAATASGEVPLAAERLRVGAAVREEQAGAFAGVSASAGARLAVAGPLSLRASVGRSFRVPSFAELYLEQGLVEPNPELRPETGLGGDAALVVEGARAHGSAGVFATVYDDLIVYEAASFRRVQARNDARTDARGVELEGGVGPFPAWLGAGASAAYTLLRAETLRGTAEELGKDVPNRPRHRVHARAGVAPGPLDIHAEVDWTSRRWQDVANTQAVPAALLVGCGASLRLVRAPELRLHVEVRNLLDDRTLSDSFGNPLPGRTVLVSVRSGSPTPGARE